MSKPLPADENGIVTFITAFEEGTLPKEQWTHAAHILTGAWYVHTLGEEAALVRMRERVSAFNLAAGGMNTATAGYHESVTVFWIKLLASLHRQSAGMPPGRFAWHAVERFAADRRPLQEFYSYDVVASVEARRTWVPPDLRPISCGS